MSTTLRRVPEQLTPTTARVNGHPVTVEQDHRRWSAADYTTAAGAPLGEQPKPEPVLVTVAAPVSLAVEDVTAVLFDWNYPVAGMADDDTVRYLVAYTVISAGCQRIEELRCRLGATETTLDPVGAAYLAYCRARATAVFAPSGGARQQRAGVGVG